MKAKVNFATIITQAFMRQKFLKPEFFLQLFGIIIPSLIYFQSVCSYDNTICRIFIENAAYAMLFFFLFGFVALSIKKPYLMLFSWIYTIMLCQFLKDSSDGSFYYTKIQNYDNCIRVANFKFDEAANDETMLNKIKELNVDLISLSLNKEITTVFKMKLISDYPYSVDLGLSKNGTHNFLYSKFDVKFVRNHQYKQIPCASGQIILDSIEGKKIRFLSFLIDEKISKNPDHLNNTLVSISNLKTQVKNNEPLIVFGEVSANAWEKELRNFRTKMHVSDSRLDLDLEKSGKHIFFSQQMRCVHFRSFENGVLGTYELRKPKMSNDDIVISAR